MRLGFLVVGVVLATVSLVISGCTPAAPAPTPTLKAPAAPTRAPEPPKASPVPTKTEPVPTKPSAAQPTAVPAKKVDFPNKPITVIMPLAAGGSTDVGARLLADEMEKQFKVAVQVVNRPGGGSQVGMSELARANPDGYTMAVLGTPTLSMAYLDPTRKATYGRKDLLGVAQGFYDTMAIAVPSDSPLKSVRDLVEAARTNPGKVKVATSGLMSGPHVPAVQLQKMQGVKFAFVHFDGGGPGLTALLGGHVDAIIGGQSQFRASFQAGKLRVIGIADEQESKLWPGVPTWESQGSKIYARSAHLAIAPAGTPKEIVDILSKAIKSALESEEVKKKATALGLEYRYLDPAEVAAFWDKQDADLLSLMDALRE